MPHEASGFSLVETLIATTITIVGITAIAQLFVVSSAANARAKSATLSTVLALDKMETLIAEGGDDGGSDFVDSGGRSIGSGAVPPPGTAFVRRWSVQPLSEGSPATVSIEVSVTRVAGRTDTRIAGVRSASIR
jgi:type II secretory pathway pseudopilin PulG